MQNGGGAWLTNRSNSVGEVKLTPITRATNDSTTENDLLSAVLAVQKFRVYLGRPFDLVTDSRALRLLNTLDAHEQKGH